jgi:hypothetical protein
MFAVFVSSFAYPSVLKMEAVCTSEYFVDVYRTIRCHIPVTAVRAADTISWFPEDTLERSTFLELPTAA